MGDDTTPIAVADTEFTYDALNRITSILHKTSATTWASYGYVYDAASRIVSIDSFLDGLSQYEHDETNQLIDADHTGSADESYEYDANGNRVMGSYDVGDNNQLSTDGTYNYAYDEEGNRETRTKISDGYVTRYSWDHRNRLVKVTEEDNVSTVLSTVEHSYDAFNRWIRRSADDDGLGGNDPVDTFFAYDGYQLVLEIAGDEGNDLSHVYTWGPMVDQLLADFTEGDVPQWALTDHLGTVRDFVEYNAGLTDTVATGHRIFDSFGNITSQTGISSRIGFTGRPFEETTGLQNNLHRWYDPASGGWVSEDPIGFAGNDANLRRYVGNDSTRFLDPIGLDRWLVFRRGHWFIVVEVWDPTGSFVIGYQELHYSAWNGHSWLHDLKTDTSDYRLRVCSHWASDAFQDGNLLSMWEQLIWEDHHSGKFHSLTIASEYAFHAGCIGESWLYINYAGRDKSLPRRWSLIPAKKTPNPRAAGVEPMPGIRYR